MVAVVFVVLAVILQVVLQRTKFGYRVQAVGSNLEAARLAGIQTGRTKVQVMVLMGLVCGFSGALFVGFRGAIDPTSGSEFALIVIAAVIIGGTPLSGGSGTVIGAMIGASDHHDHQQRHHLLWHRRHLEHVRDRRRHRHRCGHRPVRSAASEPGGGRRRRIGTMQEGGQRIRP